MTALNRWIRVIFAIIDGSSLSGRLGNLLYDWVVVVVVEVTGEDDGK